MFNRFIEKNKMIVGIAALTMLCPALGFAMGTKDSGGDPMAEQFAELGIKLGMYFTNNPDQVPLPFDAKKFASQAESLQQSMNDENATHRIEFTAEVLHDSRGVEKPAVFNGAGRIRVNRAAWVSENSEERLVQVALEIGGLIGVPERYETMQQLLEGRVRMIELLAIEKSGERSQNGAVTLMDVKFSRLFDIKSDDELIDVGQLASGSPSIKRFFEFLKNPSADSELWTLTNKAWRRQKPANFLIHAPGGNGASLTSLSTINEGELRFQALSVYFRKIAPIYGGICAEDAPTLSAAERLSKCYLNGNLYTTDLADLSAPYIAGNARSQAAAIQSVFTQWSQSLTSVYAWDYDSMSAALRNAFIRDFSTVAIDGSEQRPLLVAALGAAGLVPDLINPSDLAPFWRQTKQRDPKAVRLYEAARALADRHLVYIDANLSCPADGRFPKGMHGNALVDRQAAHSTLKEGKCMDLAMGLGPLEGRFFATMTDYGFYYDPKLSQWSFSPPQTQKSKGLGR